MLCGEVEVSVRERPKGFVNCGCGCSPVDTRAIIRPLIGLVLLRSAGKWFAGILQLFQHITFWQLKCEYEEYHTVSGVDIAKDISVWSRGNNNGRNEASCCFCIAGFRWFASYRDIARSVSYLRYNALTPTQINI